MEEWITMFKESPVTAVGAVVAAGIWWLVKNFQEKRIDNREVDRLTTALQVVIKERDDERERADEAFRKQLELTERFSEMRAQNERLLERMESMDKHMEEVIEDNRHLREQIAQLNTKVRNLQSTLDVGNIS